LPPGSTTPNSYNKPRSALIVAVRTLTQCCLVRCSDITACCSTFLIGTRRMSDCCAASQIARASAASSLLLRTNGRTWRAGSNSTS